MNKKLALGAALMYPLAYLYAWAINQEEPVYDIALLIFALGFIGLVELMNRGKKAGRESLGLLACLLIISFSNAFLPHRIWCDGWPVMFMHLLAVWWAVTRSGCLLEGENEHLFLFDALNGFFVFPFSHFFLRIRSFVELAASGFGRQKEKKNASGVLWSALGLALAAFLFSRVLKLLGDADEGFGRLVWQLNDWLDGRFTGDFWCYFLASLPVGAYLFGLIGGMQRVSREKLDGEAAAHRYRLSRMGRVPDGTWELVLWGFAALYLLFFGVQGSYLVGGFLGRLPEGFNASEYARAGFFELCRVMAINLILLWLVLRLGKTPLPERKRSRRPAAVLLVESLLLAVTAFSKIALYISMHGFTPKRLQAAWLVTVLVAGCGCALYSLFTRKKSLRFWLAFGTVTLTLLHLY